LDPAARHSLSLQLLAELKLYTATVAAWRFIIVRCESAEDLLKLIPTLLPSNSQTPDIRETEKQEQEKEKGSSIRKSQLQVVNNDDDEEDEEDEGGGEEDEVTRG